MTTYNNTFNLQILHEYYADNQCKDILVQADVPTANRLKQWGMGLKSSGNTFLFFAPANFDWSSTLADNPALSLDFNLYSSDPNFVNFTESPVQEMGNFLFTNAKMEKNTGGQIPLERQFQKVNGAVQETAIIKIKLAQLLPSIGKESIQFTAQFTARKVAWRYNVLEQAGRSLGQLTLGGKDAELFQGPVKMKIFNGQEADTFSSGEHLIPFSERANIELSLKGENGGNQQLLIDHLPSASPQSLQLSKDDNKQVLLSEIFVYV